MLYPNFLVKKIFFINPLSSLFKALIPIKAFFEIGIKDIKINTIAVVDVITQYLMTFGRALLRGHKKRGFYPSQFRSIVNQDKF